MVLVGGFGAHQLDFRLSVPFGGNGFCWAGWGTGQSAPLGDETGSSRRLLVGGIVGWFRLLLGLQAALIPQSKFGLAVGPEVQLGPDPLVLVIKRQVGRPLGPQAQSGAAVALRIPQVQPDFAGGRPQRGPECGRLGRAPRGPLLPSPGDGVERAHRPGWPESPQTPPG